MTNNGISLNLAGLNRCCMWVWRGLLNPEIQQMKNQNARCLCELHFNIRNLFIPFVGDACCGIRVIVKASLTCKKERKKMH